MGNENIIQEVLNQIRGFMPKQGMGASPIIQGKPSMGGGGVTKAKEFVVGERGPEVVKLHGKNASAEVIPNEKIGGLGDLPGFQEGTEPIKRDEGALEAVKREANPNYDVSSPSKGSPGGLFDLIRDSFQPPGNENTDMSNEFVPSFARSKDTDGTRFQGLYPAKATTEKPAVETEAKTEKQPEKVFTIPGEQKPDITSITPTGEKDEEGRIINRLTAKGGGMGGGKKVGADEYASYLIDQLKNDPKSWLGGPSGERVSMRPEVLKAITDIMGHGLGLEGHKITAKYAEDYHKGLLEQRARETDVREQMQQARLDDAHFAKFAEPQWNEQAGKLTPNEHLTYLNMGLDDPKNVRESFKPQVESALKRYNAKMEEQWKKQEPGKNRATFEREFRKEYYSLGGRI